MLHRRVIQAKERVSTKVVRKMNGSGHLVARWPIRRNK
jgi:hypothetical protein